MGSIRTPGNTDIPLVIDSYVELSLAITVKGLESVVRQELEGRDGA
jgi:hypothetical protein